MFPSHDRVGDLITIRVNNSEYGLDDEKESVYQYFEVKGINHEMGHNSGIGEHHSAIIEVSRVSHQSLQNKQEATGYKYPDSLTGEERTDGHDSIFDRFE